MDLNIVTDLILAQSAFSPAPHGKLKSETLVTRGQGMPQSTVTTLRHYPYMHHPDLTSLLRQATPASCPASPDTVCWGSPGQGCMTWRSPTSAWRTTAASSARCRRVTDRRQSAPTPTSPWFVSEVHDRWSASFLHCGGPHSCGFGKSNGGEKHFPAKPRKIRAIKKK